MSLMRYEGRVAHFILCLMVVLLVVLFAYRQASLDILNVDFSLWKGRDSMSATPQPYHQPLKAEVKAEPDTLLLIWMWPFGYTFKLMCEQYGVKGCRLSANRSLYHQAHGVIIHHRDIHSNLDNLPTEPRPSFQKWVWFNVESPTNSALMPALNDLFNLTCSYREDSHVSVPSFRLVQRTSKLNSFKLPAKDKVVCWVVSHWDPKLERVQYYNRLKQHIHIEGYGNYFGKRVDNEEFINIIRSCKFYLSFENSKHRDYITEKTFKPLLYGSVPVVLGPSRQNYEKLIPADAFIHVDDFSSAKELAERLLDLDQNTAEYMKYLRWNERFDVRRSNYPQEYVCRSCGYLQKNKGHQEFHDLNHWFWG